MSVSAAGEDPRLIRSALISHLARSLEPLPGAPSGPDLIAWTAPLSTTRLIACLGRVPAETAAQLAAALAANDAALNPAALIADVVDAAFPRRAEPDRLRLAKFTATFLALQAEGDGTVTAAELWASGFPSAEAARLLPDAQRVIAALNDGAAEASEPLPPIDALRRAGARVTGRAA